MESTGLLIFSAVLPIVGGMILLLLGLILTDHLDALLLLFTHSDTPSYIMDKPGVASVKTYIKGVGTLFKVLGVGVMVYGFVVIGVAIF